MGSTGGLSPQISAKLKEQFSHLVVLTPDSEGYEANMLRWNTAAEHRAGAVICPLTTEDVSQIVKFLRSNSLDFAICGAGHNHRGNSLDDGVVIDLRKMNGVEVDPVAKTITTGGATVWGTVYEAAEKFGLSTVGGLIPSVGVGGFTLNGGLGWLTGAHGMALDNVLEMDVVIADGRVLTCSETQTEDLFWAMRGAGSAFGIATRFVFRAHPVSEQVWSGMILWKRETFKMEILVDFLNEKIVSKSNDGKAAIGIGAWGYDGEQKITAGAFVFYNGPEKEALDYFAPILAMPLEENEASMRPFTGAVRQEGSPAGRHWRKATASGGIIAPIQLSFFKSLFESLGEIAKLPDASQTLIVSEVHNPYGMLKKKQTDTAFPFRGNHANVQIMATWGNPENDKVMWDWTRKIDALLAKEYARRQNEEGVDETTMTSVGNYINYDGLGKSPKQLYGVNLERLLMLKKKYDPDNVFKRFVNLLA